MVLPLVTAKASIYWANKCSLWLQEKMYDNDEAWASRRQKELPRGSPHLVLIHGHSALPHHCGVRMGSCAVTHSNTQLFQGSLLPCTNLGYKPPAEKNWPVWDNLCCSRWAGLLNETPQSWQTHRDRPWLWPFASEANLSSFSRASLPWLEIMWSLSRIRFDLVIPQVLQQ